MFWLLMYELIADPFSRLNVQNSTIACWFLYARHFMLSIYLICISALLSSHAKYEYEMTRHCFYTTHDFSAQFLLTVELILKHISFKNKVCNCLICLYSYQYGKKSLIQPFIMFCWCFAETLNFTTSVTQ